MHRRLLRPGWPLLAAWMTLLAATGCRPEAPEENYADAHAAWHQERLAALDRDGWLTLAGLYWLDPGPHAFGADSSGSVVFPAGRAPAQLGILHVGDSLVHLQVAAGADVRHEGRRVQAMTLATDRDGAPTVLTHGTLRWYLIERPEGLALRLHDDAHPAREAFSGVETFPASTAWRREARFEPYATPRTVAVPTVMGSVRSQTSPGTVVFDLAGRTHRLDVLGEPEDSSFFVIFGDRTNGETTYAAGRYLWVDAPDEAGRLTLDFNKAYNPPCVFTDFATCPFPPSQNRLPVRVEAGEKAYSVEASPGKPQKATAL